MKKILFITVPLILALSVFAQLDSIWANYYTLMSPYTYDGMTYDCCNSVIENNDGHYVFAGYADEILPTNDSTTNYEAIANIYLVFTDKDGNELHSRTYGLFYYDDICNDIIQTMDGGYLLGGLRSYWDSLFTEHGIVYRMDSNGDTLWTIQIDNTNITKIYEMSDSSIILFDYDHLIKTDAVGNIQWIENIDRLSDILELNNGDYFLAGGGYDGDFSGLLYKFNADDSLLWSREYQKGAQFRHFYHIIQTSDSNFLIAGTCHDSLWLLKVNEAGDTLWTSKSESPRIPRYFVQNQQGNLYITDENDNTFFTDSIGIPIDSSVYDFTDISDMILSSNGSILLAGVTQSHGPGSSGNYYAVNIGDMMPGIFDIIPVGSEYISNSPILSWHPSTSLDTIMYEVTINTPVDTVCQADTSYTTVLGEGVYTWYITAMNSYGSGMQSASIDTFIMDNSAPLILSMDTLPDTNYSGPFTVNLEAADSLAGINSLNLFYLLPESKVSWCSTAASHISGNNYTADIPAVSKKGIVYYYFEMTDNAEPSNAVRYPAGMELYSFEVTGLTGIEDNNMKYALNIRHIDNTSIEMTLPMASPVNIKVFDLSGRMITGKSMNMTAGTHKINLNVKPGIYFVNISSKYGNESSKIIRIK